MTIYDDDDDDGGGDDDEDDENDEDDDHNNDIFEFIPFRAPRVSLEKRVPKLTIVTISELPHFLFSSPGKNAIP